MKKFRNIVVATVLFSLSLGISACSTKDIPVREHKAKTTACLIRSDVLVSGTAENQLASDLVEAKVVHGLAVREVQIEENSSIVPTLLLEALQAGCVLMISANTDYLLPLADFAKLHTNMMVLFVGGEIQVRDQPANFRWVSDDIQGAARLAGFFAAGKSESARVHLFVQGTYFQSKSIQTAFRAGVKDFEKVAGAVTEIVLVKPGNSKALNARLATLDSTDVLTVFGGRNIWQSLPIVTTDGPFLVGADLQSGENSSTLDSSVKASVERNTSKYVLGAVSSLLDREFNSQPLYRKLNALKLNTIELRITEPDSIAGSLLEALSSYELELDTTSSR
jgi:hypothetical protein